jgi:transglutaminase-like putative cysteine protease
MASNRRTLAAAVATILVSVSLYPIFLGAPLWFWDGVGAVLVVAAAGTLTRLRRLPVAACLAGGVAALLLYLNAVFSSATSFIGVVPTGTSLSQLWDLAGQGFTQAAQYAPPVPQFNGMLLLAVAGIGIVALLTDLIAVRLESAALAGLPLLLLFTEPFTLSLSRGVLGTTIAFCLGTVGYLGMLSSEGKDRIREWEHPNPDPRLMPDTRALAAAGRRVGTASVVLALFVPLVIPGLHATRLFSSGQPGIGGSGGSGSGGGVGFPSPDTQLSSELHTSAAATEFTYTSTALIPDYFQVYVLDDLTSSGWRMFGQPESLVPEMPAPPGLTSDTWATLVTTHVTMSGSVGQDALGALPVPYPAISVSALGSLQADRNSLMVFDNGARLAGLRYSVTSLDESPSTQALTAAQAPSADIASHYTEVPSSYQGLRGLAQSVVRQAGATTAFEEAVALQQWLAGASFRYTLDAPTVTDATGLANFLENTRQGYCQQFSFAMAVLARLLGIPSRVAYGFTAGTNIAGDSWLVTTHDAHAWPELYFQGFGWLRFEPTPPGNGPGQGTAAAPAYTLPASTSPQSSTPSSGGLKPGALGSTSNRNAAALGDRLGLPLGGASSGAASASGRLNPWEILGLCVLGLLVIAATGPAGVRLLIRRRRWRARAAAARAHAAWRELRDDLVDYRVGYRPSESPRAAAARASASLGLAEPAAAALHRIAMAEERARYAARADSAAGLRHDSAVVRRAIAAAVPWWTRWRARLLPSSVLSPALAAVGQAADIFGRLNPDWFARARLARAPRPGNP